MGYGGSRDTQMMRSLRARAMRQTDRQTDSPRMRTWGSRQTQMMRSLRYRAVKQADRQADRQTDRLTSDETMRQQTDTDDEVTQIQGCETDRQTDKQTDRQTDRQIHL